MQLKDFDYNLPERLIAQKPLPHRDQSRLLVLERKTGKITHSTFRDFPGFLKKQDVLVINESRVIPARIWGKKEGKDIEFLFLKAQDEKTWEVLCRPAKKVAPADIIVFSPALKGKVTEVKAEGRRLINFPSGNVLPELRKIGFAPLPPYIKRKEKHLHLREFDLDRYQTVFAQKEGSIAAPTAGLHFTANMLKTLKNKGIITAPLSLDVGLATFQPVRADIIEDHKMLEETFTIKPDTAQTINKAKSDSRPVTAVGTTSVRSLESAFTEGKVQVGDFSTRLFIYPGYKFKVIDRLLTNFHLPKSTLLMLTSAFAGFDLIMEAYREAVRSEYRFFSYGDCMLIL